MIVYACLCVCVRTFWIRVAKTKPNGKEKTKGKEEANKKVGNTNRPLRDKEVKKESMQAESSAKKKTKNAVCVRRRENE